MLRHSRISFLNFNNALYRTGSIRPRTSSITKPQEKSQAEFDDEDALQLALSLSQREAEEKERQKKFLTQQYANSTIQYPPTPIGSAPIADDNVQTYWENQTKQDLITIKPLTKVINTNKTSFISFLLNLIGSIGSICT